ncbi:hypothetical protein DFH06DRAFT_413651 [Mycena polygramma]|nr:hypothetical protein DFH06DRAFT_413651 [Mycena polygramma]
MIVLYAVTGCVSFLFCIIIISGAVKAIRHPERYGPRARNHDGLDGWGQSRARGLTRAILDTFPIVKFGSNTREEPASLGRMREIKPHSDHGILLPSSPPASGLPNSGGGTSSSALNPTENNRPLAITDPERTNELPGHQNIIPPAIGRETCPICIVDFEEGDDLRILPCDGAHRFHQQCVDPWLLQVSTSCPLCRHDFIALENMISGGPDVQDSESNHRISRLRRFSRHLRFARHGRDSREEDPTRPSISEAAEDRAPAALPIQNSQV